MSEIGFFLELERGVWDAVVAGDAGADRAALSSTFVGIDPTGFADADDHAGQLEDGPSVAEYHIDRERLLEIADGHVMLSYRATYRRPGSDTAEQMYISSLWSLVERRWLNVFSQDTPVGGSVV